MAIASLGSTSNSTRPIPPPVSLPVRSVWLAPLAVNPDDMLNGYIPAQGGIGPDIHELNEMILALAGSERVTVISTSVALFAAKSREECR